MYVYVSDLSLLISIIFSLAVTMAGQSVKASAEMLKNAVIANPTAKHTATVGKSTLRACNSEQKSKLCTYHCKSPPTTVRVKGEWDYEGNANPRGGEFTLD